MWWGIYLIACNVPFGSLTIFSALTSTILVRCVTGVPRIERHMRDNPEYQAYKRDTNVFMPWFSKRSADIETDPLKRAAAAGYA